MIPSSFTGLFNNVALLVTMGAVYGSFPVGKRSRQWPGKLLRGIFLGAVGIGLMMNPWQLTPGVIFDARSILLSVGGLFLGILPMAVALVMTCFYRLHEGGVGALTGSAVIITSGVIGLIWSHIRQRPAHDFSGWEYFLFGILVHTSMLLWMLTLPHPVGITVLKNISLPVMLIFPVGTVLFAKLLAGQEKRLADSKTLHESEERFKALAETSPLAIYLSTGIEQKAKYINPTFVRLFGYDINEVPSAEKWWPLAYPDETYRLEISEEWQSRVVHAMKTRSETEQMETVVTCKDGSRKNILWGFKTIGDENWAFGLDLTKLKQVEAELRQSEATIRNKLKTIVDPEGHIDTLELSDIIDTEILQSMMEDFFKLTGMLGAILDTSGKVLVGVGWQKICTKFHRCHPDTLLNCIESDTILTDDVPPGTFKTYRCKNNMWDMVTPLMVGNRHIGNVFIGQFFYEDETPDVELFRKQALRYGFDETEYLEALDQVPRFSQETVNAGMHFYAKLSGIISSLSFSSIQQARALAQQKRSEEEIRRSRQRFQIIFKQAPIGIAIIESLTGKLIHVNSMYGKIVGRTRKEMETIDWMSITHPDDVQKDLDNMALLNDLKIDSYQMNKRYLKPDGTVVWANLSVVPIQEENMPHELHLAIIEDITDRKQSEEDILRLLTEAESSRRTLLSVVEDQKLVEEKIRKLNEELEQRVLDRTTQLHASNKELEAFSYSVSHDLRAPLRSIDGFSQALLEDYQDKPLDDTGKDFLERVRKASQRMGALIDDMLTLSRISQADIKKEPVDLSGMVRDMVEKIQKAHPERIVSVNVQKGIVTHGDPHLLMIAMENLLENAFKFTGKNAHPRIEFGMAVKDGQEAFFIKDNGAGFEMTYVDKLFKAFQRLHASDEFPGTGIGLATVQRIISRHGGQVRAEGETGKGATFHFTLPLAG